MAAVQVKVGKLIKLLNMFKRGFPSVKIGIIGDKAAIIRDDGEHLTNAQIGLIQEFGKHTGKRKIPARSFIVMPLKLHLNKYLKNKSSMTEKAFEKSVKAGKTEEFVAKIGLVAEEVIQDAFATSGWGNWAPNRPSTVKRKGSSKPLIDTGELRRSISSKVVKK